MDTLLILGAGGHAKVVADCALATGRWASIAFLDDRYPSLEKVNHWSVIGKASDMKAFISQFPEMAVGVGVSYEALRLEWIKQGQEAGVEFPAIVHPSATVSPFTSIGDGSVVFAGAVVNINTSVGSGCIINTASSIDHDCIIGDGSHISPGAILGGNVKVGETAWIGMGAKIIQGCSLGDSAVVGAGTVVLSDVFERSKVVGVPARPVN